MALCEEPLPGAPVGVGWVANFLVMIVRYVASGLEFVLHVYFPVLVYVCRVFVVGSAC